MLLQVEFPASQQLRRLREPALQLLLRPPLLAPLQSHTFQTFGRLRDERDFESSPTVSDMQMRPLPS